MTNEHIDALIVEAGLADVVRIFDSAIEIGSYNMDVDGYAVLARLILAERSHCARICEDVGRDGGTASDAAQAIRDTQ